MKISLNCFDISFTPTPKFVFKTQLPPRHLPLEFEKEAMWKRSPSCNVQPQRRTRNFELPPVVICEHPATLFSIKPGRLMPGNKYAEKDQSVVP